MPFKYPSLQARLLANSRAEPCPKQELGPCLIWTGKKNNRGYGVINMRTPTGELASRLAHRISYRAFVGEDLPLRNRRRSEGLGLHLCNVKACIEPAHLKKGTQRENVRQCVEEGRHRNMYGSTA